MASRHIIVVEDEPLLRENLEIALSTQGYTVKTAEDGEQALKALKETNSSCLLLVDLLMPNMDGWELLERIRDHGQANGLSHRTLVISGSANAEDIARQMESGFLAKPFQLADLIAVVERYADLS